MNKNIILLSTYCLFVLIRESFSFLFFLVFFQSKLKVFVGVSFMYSYVMADIHVSVADMFCSMVTVFFC